MIVINKFIAPLVHGTSVYTARYYSINFTLKLLIIVFINIDKTFKLIILIRYIIYITEIFIIMNHYAIAL